MTDPHVHLGDDLREVDDWAKRKLANLTERSNQHVLSRRPLNDPDYRALLGEQRAFLRLRSFIHGGMRARNLDRSPNP